MRSLTAALLLLTASLGFTHSDPFGETHPGVTANTDGSFTITFEYHTAELTGKMRMVLGADGKELVRRHWIEPDDESGPGAYPDLAPSVRLTGPVKPGGREWFSLKALPENGKETKPKARILPVDVPASGMQSMRIAGKELAFAFGEPVESHRSGMALKVAWCRSDGFQPARTTAALGMVACIYDFPRVSRLSWSGGRWWLAWVREKEGDTVTYTTVLSSVDPVSGKVEHHDLPGTSTWNTRLSLAVNAKGTLCVAWHAAAEGNYPGTAKIVTALFTPGK